LRQIKRLRRWPASGGIAHDLNMSFLHHPELRTMLLAELTARHAKPWKT